MDYQKFRRAFENSGMSQRAYGEQISMSSSMVSYYIRKAREEDTVKSDGKFQEVNIQEPIDHIRHIKIVTSDGLQISIPI